MWIYFINLFFLRVRHDKIFFLLEEFFKIQKTEVMNWLSTDDLVDEAALAALISHFLPCSGSMSKQCHSCRNPIWARGWTEDLNCVTFELSHLGSVLTNNKLALGKAMAWDELLVVRGPEDGAHLKASTALRPHSRHSRCECVNHWVSF